MSEIKPHLSNTQIMGYVNCPAHYLFSYVCGLKVPPASSMVRGRSVHKSIAGGYEYKREKGSNPKLSEMLEIYEFDFKKETTNQDVRYKKDETPEQMIDSGVKGLKLYHAEVMPRIKPVEIEREFLLEFKNTDFSFKGIIDLIDDTGIVHDHKTTGKTPNQIQIDNDQQLSGYTMGCKLITGKKPKSLQLDYLVLTKEPKIVPFKTTRSDEDIRRWLINLAMIKKAIDAGLFYCVHTGGQNWVCSKENCAYEEKGYHTELYKLGVNGFIEKYGNGGDSEIIYDAE